MPKVKIGNITLKKAIAICGVQEFTKKTCEGCPLFIKDHAYVHGCVLNMHRSDLCFVTDIKVDIPEEK